MSHYCRQVNLLIATHQGPSLSSTPSQCIWDLSSRVYVPSAPADCHPWSTVVAWAVPRVRSTGHQSNQWIPNTRRSHQISTLRVPIVHPRKVRVARTAHFPHRRGNKLPLGIEPYRRLPYKTQRPPCVCILYIHASFQTRQGAKIGD